MEAELLKRIEELEKEVKRQRYYTDMQEIEQLKGRYVYLMENNEVGKVWDELFVHDDPDVSMELHDSGTYIGPDHVKRAWYSIAGLVDADGNPKQPRGQDSSQPLCLIMLDLTTPYIVVAPDGKSAIGDWHVFGPHALPAYDPETGTRRMTAYWLAGKFHHEFVKVNGQWKFKHFQAICWLRAPYEKGWLHASDVRRSASPYYPPDKPPRNTFYHPDEPYRPDRWGPLPPPIIDYHE